MLSWSNYSFLLVRGTWQGSHNARWTPSDQQAGHEFVFDCQEESIRLGSSKAALEEEVELTSENL